MLCNANNPLIYFFPIYSADHKKSSENTRSPEPTSEAPPSRDVPSSYPNPIPPPPSFAYAEPSLSSHEWAKKRENELKENDQYWKRRLASIETNYHKINASLEQEYNTTVNNLYFCKNSYYNLNLFSG